MFLEARMFTYRFSFFEIFLLSACRPLPVLPALCESDASFIYESSDSFWMATCLPRRALVPLVFGMLKSMMITRVYLLSHCCLPIIFSLI